MHYSNIYYKKLTPNVDPSKLPHIIWGHGWGNSHVSLLPIANNLKNLGTHWLLDFPGFGLTAKPETEAVWGIKEYTEITMDWIKGTIPIDAPKIWIGHSFGCRVGINLAASEPKLLQGLLLIAASGIPRPRNLLQKVRFKNKIYIFKLLKYILLLFKQIKYLEQLKTKFGSIDYKNADPIMQKILIKIINEDLSLQAKKIISPTEFIYGLEDQETPGIRGE
ncbi:MAG: alpha/beta fold hydrolase, partial [Gammaproteobacteria bacterium]